MTVHFVCRLRAFCMHLDPEFVCQQDDAATAGKNGRASVVHSVSSSMGEPSVAVLIATYGSDLWREKGRLAMESLASQVDQPDETIWVHGESLAAARNRAASVAQSEFLVFLDADDGLDSQYVASIRSAASRGMLIQPAHQRPGSGEARVAPTRDLRISNFLVIGTAVPSAVFRTVGGFRNWSALEDWDLWARCSFAGLSVIQAPKAVYRIGRDGNDGRNSRSNLLLKWRIRNSWTKLPFRYGGIRQPGLVTQLVEAILRRLRSAASHT